MGKLDGKTIAVLFTDGVEQVELDKPVEGLRDEGADVEYLTLEPGEVQAFNHLDHADKIQVGSAVKDADASDYDALLLPGGVANPDFLRGDEDAVSFVRGFVEQAKPIPRTTTGSCSPAASPTPTSCAWTRTLSPSCAPSSSRPSPWRRSATPRGR